MRSVDVLQHLTLGVVANYRKATVANRTATKDNKRIK